MVSAKAIFDPSATARDEEEVNTPVSPMGWRLIRDFYRDRLAWVALITTGLCTAYVGGAVMFYVHSIRLGEGGPDIPPVAHWALDSTAGFLGLTPALALLLPAAVQASGARHRSPPAVRRSIYVLITGFAFAVITIPGPIMHDMLVARGTWLADVVTRSIGPGGGSATQPTEVPTIVSIGYQFGIGLPAYIVSVGLALLLIRLAVAVYVRFSRQFDIGGKRQGA